MNLTILTIGTELTRGDLVDANSKWLAQKLGDLGYEVTEIRCVNDDQARIVSTLGELSERSDVLIVTGGLGPTSDDLTTACAARLARVPLVRDEATLQHVRGIFEKHNVAMHEMNQKQADFPEGAKILANALGTAPGFSLRLGRALAFFTPGVPAEMRHIFETGILPALPPLTAPLSMKRLTVYGVPESQVAGHLEDIESRYSIPVGYRAAPSEIEVKLVTRAHGSESQADVNARLLAAFAEVQTRLGGYLKVEGRTPLPEFLLQELGRQNQTLGVAESCTGGGIAHLITAIAGSSAVFRGSIVAYHNDVKRSVLGVSEATLAAHGAVSREVALEMAEGARRVLGVDLALSVTGIAGPGGGTPDKPVGLVHYAASTAHGSVAKVGNFRGDRENIRRRAAVAALLLGVETLRTPR
jgi:nicotinamide-nucleotide amidase